jgi:hypothetical protein
MGWLFMPFTSMGGHKTAKSYLDAQLTYERTLDDGVTAGSECWRPPVREPHLLRRGSGTGRRRSRKRLCRRLPGALEPALARWPSIWIQGQCAVAALKWSISDDEVS